MLVEDDDWSQPCKLSESPHDARIKKPNVICLRKPLGLYKDEPSHHGEGNAAFLIMMNIVTVYSRVGSEKYAHMVSSRVPTSILSLFL